MRNMLRKMIVAEFILAAMFVVGFEQARAQDSAPAKTAPTAERVVNAYRLDFSVNEVEDGKKINSRQYSMDLNSDSSNELKIGTRVPVETKEGEFQYLDVGTNLWSRLEDHTGQINLVVRAEISNFAIPDQNQDHNARSLIRQVKIDGSTVATPGKPMLIGSVDDPNSKKQFQLEVTLTKLR
jgi:hypothetical protein